MPNTFDNKNNKFDTTKKKRISSISLSSVFQWRMHKVTQHIIFFFRLHRESLAGWSTDNEKVLLLPELPVHVQLAEEPEPSSAPSVRQRTAVPMSPLHVRVQVEAELGEACAE